MVAFSVDRNRAAATLLCLPVLALLAGCAERELILEGERFNPRAPLEASILVEGQPAPVDATANIANQNLPITLPAAQANADWTQRAGNARHLMPHGTLGVTPARVWSVGIGAGNSRKFRVTAAPVVAGGRVYAMDATSRVSAVSTAGVALWAVDMAPEGARGDVSGGGLAFGDGRLFVTTGQGELVAVDPASGAVIWRQALGAAASGAPTVEGGIVYAVGRDSSAWAVKTDTGRVLWQLPATPSLTGMIGSAAPAVTDRAVLFPFASGEVVAALKKGGVRLWGITVAGERLGRGYAGVSDITGDPVVVGDVTYIGNQSGRTVAISTASGDRIWTAREGAYGPVLPVGGSVFLVSDEARLVRLDAQTGLPIWSVEMPYYTTARDKRRKAITAHYGPVLAGGRLAVASGDGQLRFFSPVNGALVGSVDLPGGAASQPALAGGALYVVSGNGQLHAFR